MHAFFVVCKFFFKLTYSKKSFRNTIRVSNSLDPDQARHFVRPDLGPNCLQRLSADDKLCHYQKEGERINMLTLVGHFISSLTEEFIDERKERKTERRKK